MTWWPAIRIYSRNCWSASPTASPGPSRALSVSFLALCLAGCAGHVPGEPACLLPNQQSFVAIDLYFGRVIGNAGRVSDAQWGRFVARVITPRFPEGFSVLDASGQWRDPSTRLVAREPSKLVRILATPDSGLASRIQAVADAYRRDFAQESVGIVSQSACAAF